MIRPLRLLLVALITFSSAATATAQESATGRQLYLELAEEAYHAGVTSCPEAVERWKAAYQPTHLWGYGPTAEPIWFARLAATLYAIEGKEEYAREALRWLAGHHEFKELYPKELQEGRPEYANGLPTLSDFFQLCYFNQAWLFVRESPEVTARQRAVIEASIAESADFVFSSPEWGPMNRAILRAEGLLLAARALPDHPRAEAWEKMAGFLGDDSWEKWEEEDAQIYHPVWISTLIRYADARRDPSIFTHPTMRYYFDYFVHLLAPTGMVPMFGDSRWNENWAMYIACLERGAAQYGREDCKWAANRIVEGMLPIHQRPLPIRVGMELADAYRWTDDSIAAKAPPARSEEVMEDLVGKKIVFRSGWEADSTYLLLNYRDEGPFASVPRAFLRATIPVEEEKGHHGHADENSICLLTDGGSVLLNDAGYRDRIPSGEWGAFRADYFHNRLVARTGKRDREQELFEFLRHSGAYHPVQTEKIDFFSCGTLDVSRTRLVDRRTGYQADRVIAYLAIEGIFVVFDIVEILETGFYTFSTLWHAQRVLEEGERYFVTANDSIGEYELGKERALLIAFPQGGIRRDGTFPMWRQRQDEYTVYQTLSSHYHAGQVETFVTVLVPHDRGAPVAPLAEQFRALESDFRRDGVGVELRLGDGVRYVCVKTDLDRELLSANVRPRYSWESGKVAYGPIETDASFLYGHRLESELYYVATHLIGIRFDGEPVFEARENTFTLQPDDLSSGFGAPKWRAWEDTVQLDGE